MNVNFQTRIAGQGGMPVIDVPILTGEGVKQKADDVSLNVTETKSSGPSGQTKPRELDAPEVNGQMTLNDLDKTFGKLGGAFGKPNGAPVKLGDAPTPPTPPAPKPSPSSAPARLTAAFNIVAILDLIQVASNEMLKVSREMNRNERQHKAALQENTGKLMRETGEASAAAAKTGAILGSVMTGVAGVLSVCGFREQFKAFSKADVKVEELAAKESTDLLKEVKGFKDVAGEEGLVGKFEQPKGGQFEMKELKGEDILSENKQNPPAEEVQKPQVENSKLFSEDVASLSGEVHKRAEEFNRAEKAFEDGNVKLVGAQQKMGDFKPGDNSQEAFGARTGLDSQRMIHEQNRMALHNRADEHIAACKRFKGLMEADIAKKQAAVDKATDPAMKQQLQGELTRMKAVYNKECFNMGEGLTKSLNRKVAFTQESLEKSLISASNTEEMAWAKAFETAAGIVKQGFESGQGYNKMHGDMKEGKQKELEHLSQSSETKTDSDIEMAKNTQEDWKHMQQMMIELRKLTADLEYQTMSSIFKG